MPFSAAARRFLVTSLLLVAATAANAESPEVATSRLPDGAYQPQVVLDEADRLHMIYAKGDPAAADVYYVRSEAEGKFGAPIRVNSQPGSVLPVGTVRGAHLAVGGDGRAHVVWMGSEHAEPKGPEGATPMLYTRLNDAGEAFEPQRNVLQHAVPLDGGGTVAADDAGRVYVAWHAGGESETERRIWIARSEDGGQSFDRETAVSPPGRGVCPCCGMTGVADGNSVWLAYRAATDSVDRDIYLLGSNNTGRTFETSTRADRWHLDACPMSTLDLLHDSNQTWLAWETEQQVYVARFDHDGKMIGEPVSPPGEPDGRKHPRLALDAEGRILLVWTEGTGWARGGSVGWQVYDSSLQPIHEAQGRVDDLPAWSFATPFVRPDGEFEIVY
ncbi:MAG: sialidase family protein [Phycisphaeraceae bacterium]